MKNSINIIILLFLCSCTAVGGSALEWEYDGTVRHGSQKIKTKLHNAYYAFNSEEGIYLAGFVIDEKAVNHPYVVFVKKDLTEQFDWVQQAMVEQMFIFNNQLFLLDEYGNTKVKSGQSWNKSKISFLPNSKIVYNVSDIIACVPSPLGKSSQDKGNCYSLKKGWKVNVAWRSIQPIVCGGFLNAIEDDSAKIKAHKINLDTGRIVKSIDLKSPPSQENLCNMFVSK
jgi:hypothetical protein